MPSAAYQREWRRRNRDKVKAYNDKPDVRRRRREHQRRRAAAGYHRGWLRELWRQFLMIYGPDCIGTNDGRPCPSHEAAPERLTVGHLFNDGKHHRSRMRSDAKRPTAGIGAILDLRRRGWPCGEGIAAQCGSCQIEDMRRQRHG